MGIKLEAYFKTFSVQRSMARAGRARSPSVAATLAPRALLRSLLRKLYSEQNRGQRLTPLLV